MSTLWCYYSTYKIDHHMDTHEVAQYNVKEHCLLTKLYYVTNWFSIKDNRKTAHFGVRYTRRQYVNMQWVNSVTCRSATMQQENKTGTRTENSRNFGRSRSREQYV